MTSLERARVAVAVAFVMNGVAISSWISRLPAARDALGLSSTQLGLLLLCLSFGACSSLPASGPLVRRFGAARVVLGGGVVVSGGLVATAAGLALPSVVLAAVGLLFVGLGMGCWDVAMNVEGAAVESGLGRVLMPRLHAAFSVGTVGGALLGAGSAAAAVALSVQLVGTALLVLLSLVLAVRAFLPAEGDAARQEGSAGETWRERRTLLVGLFVLCFGLIEGSAYDWLAVAYRDGHGASEVVAALGFGCFVAAMTVTRLLGGALLLRFGRVLLLRSMLLLALGGLLLVVFSPSLPFVFAGTLLWGVGAAMGFPVGISAAADDPARAAVRVSVVSSVAYTAFLAGPPLVGFLADAFGVLRALLVLLLALAAAAALAGSLRPLPPLARAVPATAV